VVEWSEKGTILNHKNLRKRKNKFLEVAKILSGGGVWWRCAAYILMDAQKAPRRLRGGDRGMKYHHVRQADIYSNRYGNRPQQLPS
jgi:hypothetical protein